jgi:hypothetical protein
MEQPNKLAEAPTNGNASATQLDNSGDSAAVVTTASPPLAADPTQAGIAPTAQPALPVWPIFLKTAKPQDTKGRFAAEVAVILEEEGLKGYCCLGLLEPDDSINTADLDAIFSALSSENAQHDKDVLLFLLCRGGSIEPAYQISKICKAFAKKRFIVAVPRQAKSAATLVALGADEIHMGPLGQLGPIDPQLGGLPALGVSQALQTIACVAEQHPGSAEMLARYLQLALTVEQIGYCDRISESAVQYAVRLLSTKPRLAPNASFIAKELVHEYKDHGFVIDIEEARMHLGSEWIKSDTAEIRAAERIYSLFESVNLHLEIGQSKRIFVMGSVANTSSVRIVKSRSR